MGHHPAKLLIPDPSRGHHVSPGLEDGTIIKQETERVNHAMDAEDFVASGRDIESSAMLNGHDRMNLA